MHGARMPARGGGVEEPLEPGLERGRAAACEDREIAIDTGTRRWHVGEYTGPGATAGLVELRDPLSPAGQGGVTRSLTRRFVCVA